MKVNLWQIKYAHAFSYDDELRPLFNSVYVVNKYGNQYVVATDGKLCLAIINKDVQGKDEEFKINTLDGKSPKIDKKDFYEHHEIKIIGDKIKRKGNYVSEIFDTLIEIGNYKFVMKDGCYPDVFSKIINLDYKEVQFPDDLYMGDIVEKRVKKLFPDITSEKVFLSGQMIRKQIENRMTKKQKIEMFLYFITMSKQYR